MTERWDAVDWASLFHSEGSATDTPRRLRALLGSEDERDAEAFIDGYALLWRTLHPRGKTAWPATAPSALLVTELLDDQRLGPDDPSLPRALLAYLQSFATAADLGDDEPAVRARVRQRAPELQAWMKAYLDADAAGRDGMWADGSGLGDLVLEQARLDCFDVVPEVLERVLPHLTLGDVRHRASAAGAVGVLARHPSAVARRPELVRQLALLAADAESSAYDVATIVIALGQLGGDTRPWLADPRPGVRGCAALAPGLAEDSAAAEVLVQLSRAPRAFEASFGGMAPPHHFMVPRRSDTDTDVLSEALLDRVRDPQALVPAVIARLPLGVTSSYRSLTPYLLIIFSNRGAAGPWSAVQRILAELIAGWDGIWALDDAARAEVFAPAGLSPDRAAWVAMAQPDPLSRGDAVYTPENIVVFEGLTIVRSRPGMFFGVSRAHPELPERVVGVLRAQFDHAVATGQVGSFRLDVEPDGAGRRFTVDVRGHQLPSTAVGYDGIFGGICSVWPLEYLSLAAALSARVWVKAWSEGRCVAVEYVDGMALGPVRTVPGTPPRDGYEVTFEI